MFRRVTFRICLGIHLFPVAGPPFWQRKKVRFLDVTKRTFQQPKCLPQNPLAVRLGQIILCRSSSRGGRLAQSTLCFIGTPGDLPVSHHHLYSWNPCLDSIPGLGPKFEVALNASPNFLKTSIGQYHVTSNPALCRVAFFH